MILHRKWRQHASLNWDVQNSWYLIYFSGITNQNGATVSANTLHITWA